MQAAGVIFFLLLAIAVGYMIWSSSYNSSNHTSRDIYVDPSATISNVDRKIVGLKGERLYRTTVLFSDGFQFISHKTDRDDKFLSYSISISPELSFEIIRDAISEHNNAFIKQSRLPRREYTASVMGVLIYEEFKSSFYQDTTWSWCADSLGSLAYFHIFAYRFSFSYNLLKSSFSQNTLAELFDSVMLCFIRETDMLYSEGKRKPITDLVLSSIAEANAIYNQNIEKIQSGDFLSLSNSLFEALSPSNNPTEMRLRNITYTITQWKEKDSEFAKYTIVKISNKTGEFDFV